MSKFVQEHLLTWWPNTYKMSVHLIVGPKCTLATWHAATWCQRVVEYVSRLL